MFRWSDSQIIGENCPLKMTAIVKSKMAAKDANKNNKNPTFLPLEW